MKILLDECLPSRFRHHIPGHEVHTVEWAGMKGLANGSLLRAAENGGYDVLITVDRGISYQQNIAGRKLAVLVLRARSNQRKDLLALVDRISDALERIHPGDVVVLHS